MGPGVGGCPLILHTNDLAETLDTWPSNDNERRRVSYDAKQAAVETSSNGKAKAAETSAEADPDFARSSPGYRSDAVLVFAFCGLRWSTSRHFAFAR